MSWRDDEIIRSIRNIRRLPANTPTTFLLRCARIRPAAAIRCFGRNNAIMAAQVQALSDDDMRDVAAYIGSLPGDLLTKK